MTIPFELDKRYAVTEEIVRLIRKARKDGETYQQIADTFGVSRFTAYYWCNDEYRERKREINSLRTRRTPEEKQKQIKQLTEKRRQLWKSLPSQRLADYCIGAKNERRSRRLTVQGIPLQELQERIQSDFRKGGRKLSL